MTGHTQPAPERRVRLDGRVLRGVATREWLCTAVRLYIDEGVFRPTAKDVARRAGVSTRSIFQHYPDMASLYAAALTDGQVRELAARLHLLSNHALARAFVSGRLHKAAQ